MTTAMTASTPDASPWTHANTILEMPNEILREIFINIDGEFSKTLWSLCLTCKHFHNIVEEYCEPEYNIRGKWIGDPYAFMEQLRDYPHLRTIIRVARMDYFFADHLPYTEEEVTALVRSLGLEDLGPRMLENWNISLSAGNGAPIWLVALLPCIETVELSTDQGGWPWTRVPLITLLQDLHDGDYLKLHPFASLRNVSLHYPVSHGEDLIYDSMLALPSLRKLSVRNVDFGVDGRGSLCSYLLEELNLTRTPYDLSVGNPCWKRFAGLRVLRVNIQNDICLDDWYPFVESLASQAHSLEVLELYTNEKYSLSNGQMLPVAEAWPAQSSLKAFKRLKRLALTELMLVGMSSSRPVHWLQPLQDTLNHLANMLPTSLETLTQILWDGPTIFSKRLTKRQQSLHSWERIWKASSRKQFPSLKQVMVQKYGLSGLSEEREVIWESKD